MNVGFLVESAIRKLSAEEQEVALEQLASPRSRWLCKQLIAELESYLLESMKADVVGDEDFIRLRLQLIAVRSLIESMRSIGDKVSAGEYRLTSQDSYVTEQD